MVPIDNIDAMLFIFLLFWAVYVGLWFTAFDNELRVTEVIPLYKTCGLIVSLFILNIIC